MGSNNTKASLSLNLDKVRGRNKVSREAPREQDHKMSNVTFNDDLAHSEETATLKNSKVNTLEETAKLIGNESTDETTLNHIH